MSTAQSLLPAVDDAIEAAVPLRPWPRLLCIGLGLLLVGAGCGSELYQQRFEETKRYFAYQDRMNQLLAPKWVGQGVEMRVPKKFQVIPGRPKPKARPKAKEDDSAAAAEEEERDPRQPTFAKIDFLGLQGAWKAELSLAGGQGTAAAYLWVLSNYELLGKPEPGEKATAFNDNVIRDLAKAVEQPIPDLNKLLVSELPKGEAYVEKRKIRILSPGLPATINDKDYRIQIYGYRKDNSPAQVSIVLVAPADVSPTEKIERAIEASLETLTVTLDKPPGTAGGGAGGASPGSVKPPSL